MLCSIVSRLSFTPKLKTLFTDPPFPPSPQPQLHSTLRASTRTVPLSHTPNQDLLLSLCIPPTTNTTAPQTTTTRKPNQTC